MAKDKYEKKQEKIEKSEDTNRKPALEKEQSAEVETSPEEPEQAHDSSPKQNWFKHCWSWLLSHKRISISLAVLLLLGVLAAIPFTRFTLAGLVLKQTFSVIVVDAETRKPVTSATVKISGKEAETDNEGRTNIQTKVGYADLTVSKKYYHDATAEVVVPIGKPKSTLQIELKADGRPVPVTVLNSISKKPADVTITAGDTEAKTDKDGRAAIVLPADKKEVPISIGGEGFNTVQTTLTVTTDDIEANIFQITPSGKIYFLSNSSGKIDLVKSNLDGTERQTVLAGTGKEDKFNTVLLASRDWKYIALLSKRDGGDHAKLFLIETGSDKTTIMDEGEATFNVYGWSGDRFIYTVDRKAVKAWEPKKQALKGYHAPTKKITTLDETAAEGNTNSNGYEYYSNSVFVLDQEVFFAKNWGGSNYYLQSKKATFNSINADGSQKKTVKSYPTTYVNTRAGDFGEIYLQYDPGTGSKVDGYHNGTISESKLTEGDFYNETYPYYSVSPTGKRTLWSDFRDGKYVFFIGDGAGENGKEIGRSEDFTVYGWFTDDYILLTKKGSELHIMSAAEGFEGGVENSPKISDYYKPNYYNQGFGYGYGG